MNKIPEMSRAKHNKKNSPKGGKVADLTSKEAMAREAARMGERFAANKKPKYLLIEGLV